MRDSFPMPPPPHIPPLEEELDVVADCVPLQVKFITKELSPAPSTPTYAFQLFTPLPFPERVSSPERIITSLSAFK